MTPHEHTELVAGCYRCELGVDELSPEQHVAGLEASVEEFARRLTAAQDAGVSHAIILPRLMLAFRRSFGELPAGFTMPPLVLPPA